MIRQQIYDFKGLVTTFLNKMLTNVLKFFSMNNICKSFYSKTSYG